MRTSNRGASPLPPAPDPQGQERGEIRKRREGGGWPGSNSNTTAVQKKTPPSEFFGNGSGEGPRPGEEPF